MIVRQNLHAFQMMRNAGVSLSHKVVVFNLFSRNCASSAAMGPQPALLSCGIRLQRKKIFEYTVGTQEMMNMNEYTSKLLYNIVLFRRNHSLARAYTINQSINQINQSINQSQRPPWWYRLQQEMSF